MSRRTAQRLTALLLICAAAAWPSAASAQGRSVPTEQIIVPPEERVMPDMPVDD